MSDSSAGNSFSLQVKSSLLLLLLFFLFFSSSSSSSEFKRFFTFTLSSALCLALVHGAVRGDGAEHEWSCVCVCVRACMSGSRDFMKGLHSSIRRVQQSYMCAVKVRVMCVICVYVCARAWSPCGDGAAW